LVALEVSILGRSIGEAIVIRFGDRLQRILLLDSFMSLGRPASLRCLERLGGDPNQVVIVAASHWDNDHSDGLAQIIRVSPNARFVYPYVVDTKKLVKIALTARLAAASDGRGRGVDAFGEVLVALKERGQPPEVARSKQTLLQDGEIHIRALSPTCAAIEAGLASVGKELLSEPSKGTVATAVKPNLTSMVLWVETATHRVLLGADLEAHASYGWAAAVEDSRTLLLGGRAQLLKVPHHGSDDADDDLIWTELLDSRPDAVVTPYGPSRRPREPDLERLMARPCKLKIAAGPNWKGWPVAAQVNPTLVAEQSSLQRGVGVVRYKATSQGGWDVTSLVL
jgi:hypothetical protein